MSGIRKNLYVFVFDNFFGFLIEKFYHTASISTPALTLRQVQAFIPHLYRQFRLKISYSESSISLFRGIWHAPSSLWLPPGLMDKVQHHSPTNLRNTWFPNSLPLSVKWIRLMPPDASHSSNPNLHNSSTSFPNTL